MKETNKEILMEGYITFNFADGVVEEVEDWTIEQEGGCEEQPCEQAYILLNHKELETLLQDSEFSEESIMVPIDELLDGTYSINWRQHFQNLLDE